MLVSDRPALYMQWNDRLARHFFRPEMAGLPVHFYVTDEIIATIGSEWNSNADGFVRNVLAGPPWATGHGVCNVAYSVFKNWRRRKLEFPPYIAYLGLFVLAAGLDGDFAPHAYYPRLRTLLHEGQEPGTYPYFDHMLELWDDLELWSNQEMRGELGVFNVKIAGSWVHVGVPIAQTILTERERKSLPSIFAKSHLAPSAPPSDQELSKSLRQSGVGYLRPRTITILSNPKSDQERYGALLETVRDELAEWDGTAPTANMESDVSQSEVYGTLFLTMKLDQVARKVEMRLRCHLSYEFPEDTLNLRDIGSLQYFCEEDIPEWSTSLRDRKSNTRVDASHLDWLHGHVLREAERALQFHLPGRPVRVLIPGTFAGLPDYVEVNQIRKAQSFIVLAHGNHCERIIDWGSTSCEQFLELERLSGLPADWRAFRCANASSDQTVRDPYPVLSFSDTIRISLRNGIRLGRGSSFFDFGVPEVVVEGGDGLEQVYCNDQEIHLQLSTDSYRLPPDLPSGCRISIDVRKGETKLRRQSLYLESAFDWRLRAPLQVFDKFGQLANSVDGSSEAYAGSWCSNCKDPKYAYAYSPEIFENDIIYFVGTCAGQVSTWPVEPLPILWSPVWAVAMRNKRGKSIFCGTDLEDVQPCVDDSIPRKYVRLWKQVLWYSRKRISSPPDARLRKLWKRYQEVAKNV